jgi:predicted dehydrogenase
MSCQGVRHSRQDLALDDIVTATIGFDDGSLGTIHYWSNGDPSLPKERIEAFAEQRVAILDNFRKLTLAAGNSCRTVSAFGQQKGFQEEAQAFADMCQNGQAPIDLQSLVDTTMATILAAEDLRDPFSAEELRHDTP